MNFTPTSIWRRTKCATFDEKIHTTFSVDVLIFLQRVLTLEVWHHE
jgi:hypothetical protein